MKAVAPIANDNKVVELIVGANSPDIAKLGDYVYTTFPLADVDITAVAKYCRDHDGQEEGRRSSTSTTRPASSRPRSIANVHQGRRADRRLRNLRSEGDRLHRPAAEGARRNPGHRSICRALCPTRRR